jgi:hypothetical protein
MEGIVTAVSATSVTATMDNSLGSGTYTSWNIGITGDKGSAGASLNIITEDTSGTLTITSQAIADLDYVLSFVLDDRTKMCHVTGTITNNTGGMIGANNIFSFINSAYNGRTSLISSFVYGVNNASHAITDFMQFNGTHLVNFGNIEDGRVAKINAFYFVN